MSYEITYTSPDSYLHSIRSNSMLEGRDQLLKQVPRITLSPALLFTLLLSKADEGDFRIDDLTVRVMERTDMVREVVPVDTQFDFSDWAGEQPTQAHNRRSHKGRYRVTAALGSSGETYRSLVVIARSVDGPVTHMDIVRAVKRHLGQAVHLHWVEGARRLWMNDQWTVNALRCRRGDAAKRREPVQLFGYPCDIPFGASAQTTRKLLAEGLAKDNPGYDYTVERFGLPQVSRPETLLVEHRDCVVSHMSTGNEVAIAAKGGVL
jgi:uncharacterized protein Veg